MTAVSSNNSNVQSQSKSNSQKSNKSNSKDNNYFSKDKGSSSVVENPIDTMEELDAKISDLEEKTEKTQKGFFAKCFNLFSKKDEKMEEELHELKDAKAKALEDDGKIDKEEFNTINKEAKESEESLDDYKESKKKAADTTATVGAIAAGVAVGVATGGAGLVAGAAIAGAASGVAKVAVKEVCLGDEYEALGKEGLKDGLISAAYGASGGVIGAAAKVAAPVAAQGMSRVGVAVTEKAAETAIRYSSKVVVDEGVMVANKMANGEEVSFSDVAVTAGASILFTRTGDALASKEILKKGSSEIIERTTKDSANTILKSESKQLFGV